MNIYDQLKRDEGVRLKPYRDTVGKLTIGVGRNLEDNGILAREADVLLQNDVATAEALLESYLPWTQPLKQTEEVRYWGLVNLCFNMGVHRLLEFKNMLAGFQAANWEQAASELANSAYAKQLPGRAARLEEQIRSGVWQ